MEVLPRDLVRKCLVGVPYKSHNNLKAVCRDWETMLSKPNFYVDRKISGTSEQLICLIRMDLDMDPRVHDMTISVYDPAKGTLESLPAIDEPQCRGIPKLCECVAVNQKLLLIGGLRPFSSIAMKSVYIYDFVSARWSRGADMSTARHSFASSVSSSTGLIYVAGGESAELSENPTAAAEAYNVEEDRWEILPPMIQPRSHDFRGVFIEGKFMVISRDASDRSAEVFDPSAGTWRRLEDRMWVSLREKVGHISYCLVATSTDSLYLFTRYDILKYDGGNNFWTTVATLPPHTCIGSETLAVTEWRDWVFVTGINFYNLGKPFYYLFNLSKGQFIEFSTGEGDIIVTSAATIEI